MHLPIILRPCNTGTKQSRSLLQLRTERTFLKRLPNEGQDSGDSPSGHRRSANAGGVRKRGTLKEDSSSGSKGIDMSEVDLSQLMGGKSFTIHCTLLCNGYCNKRLTSLLTNLAYQPPHQPCLPAFTNLAYQPSPTLLTSLHQPCLPAFSPTSSISEF